ncbi:MAG: type II toxin-antitoxin system RelE/ParE family toxin [Bryobacteraceae bacterium]
MSSRPVRFHPAALDETEAALDWDRRRSIRAAEMFLHELDHAAKRIEVDPGQFPEHLFGKRRVVLRRFPYLVIFRVTTAGVEVIGVAHGHRRPGYWRNRVE